ncbi:MAG: hemerythrin domain-containing protein [Telluria sp.]
MHATPRYDIYRRIHKALRSCFADTLARLGRADPQDAHEAAAVLAQVRQMAAFAAGHLFHEDCHIHPAMEARQPGSARTTLADHEHHDYAISKLISVAAQAEQAQGQQRAVLFAQLYQQVSLFVAENLTHMHVEETENAAVLWACYSDAELAAIEQAIVGSLTPEEKMVSMRWMIPAVTPQERAFMLGGMRQAMPVQAFEGLLGQVRPLLSGAEWGKLADALELQAA